MPLVFIFLGLIFLIILFYCKNQVILINKFFLLGVLLLALLSFFIPPLLITKNLQINALLFACFLLLIIYLSMVHSRDNINKSITFNLFVVLFYVLLVKKDCFYLLNFNILPVILLVSTSNIIAFKNSEHVFLNTVIAFFIIELYNCFYLLGEFSFASGFAPTLLLPFIISFVSSLIILSAISAFKKLLRRKICEK